MQDSQILEPRLVHDLHRTVDTIHRLPCEERALYCGLLHVIREDHTESASEMQHSQNLFLSMDRCFE
jgi:hypothetical protein